MIEQGDTVQFKDGHMCADRDFTVKGVEKVTLPGVGEAQGYVHLQGYPNRVHENWLTKVE